MTARTELDGNLDAKLPDDGHDPRARLVARIADVLAGHRENYDGDCGTHDGCYCEAPVPDAPGQWPHGQEWAFGFRSKWHAAHVADVLADVCADVWDEGRDVGHEDTYLNLIEGRGDFDAAETPNPYRVDGDER